MRVYSDRFVLIEFWCSGVICHCINNSKYVFRTQTVEAARADGEKIRLIGGAEASAIEAVGNAEAEKMRLKAAAYKQYGDAAMLSLVLETLPKVSNTANKEHSNALPYNYLKLCHGNLKCIFLRVCSQ